MAKFRLQRKTFAIPQQSQQPQDISLGLSEQSKTAAELQIEQMKTQRTLLNLQRQKQKALEEERKAQLKQVTDAQRIEQNKDEVNKNNQVKVKRMQDSQQSNAAENNWGLVKSNTRPKPAIPMK